jgi:hypothetical protein
MTKVLSAYVVSQVPFRYVEAEQSGGLKVIVPPFSGSLTTVSFLFPQAQVLTGVAKGSTTAVIANGTATNQNSQIPLLRLIFPTVAQY